MCDYCNGWSPIDRGAEMTPDLPCELELCKWSGVRRWRDVDRVDLPASS